MKKEDNACIEYLALAIALFLLLLTIGFMGGLNETNSIR